MKIRILQAALITGLLLPLLWIAYQTEPSSSTVFAQGGGGGGMFGPNMPALAGGGRFIPSRSGNTVMYDSPWNCTGGNPRNAFLIEPDGSGKFRAISRINGDGRPQTFRITQVNGAPTGFEINDASATFAASLTDGNGDGVFDTFMAQGTTPTGGAVNITLNTVLMDNNGDGHPDHVSVSPWPFSLVLTNDGCNDPDPQPWVPLADTNGDMVPDAIVPDFNGDGVADPDLYSSPRLAAQPAATADLSVTNTDSPDPVAVGSNITYMIVVRNNAGSATTNTVLTDTLGAGTTFVSVAQVDAGRREGDDADRREDDGPAPGGGDDPPRTVDGDRAVSCSHSGGTVTCNIGALAVGSSVTINVVARADQAGTLTNTASVSDPVSDPTPSNNSATATTTATPAVPTTDEYGLLLLVLLLGAVGIWSLTRRQGASLR